MEDGTGTEVQWGRGVVSAPRSFHTVKLGGYAKLLGNHSVWSHDSALLSFGRLWQKK